MKFEMEFGWVGSEKIIIETHDFDKIQVIQEFIAPTLTTANTILVIHVRLINYLKNILVVLHMLLTTKAKCAKKLLRNMRVNLTQKQSSIFYNGSIDLMIGVSMTCGMLDYDYRT